MRLQKFLRNQGIGSRRNCDKMVLDGLIKVNGKTVETPTVFLEVNDVVETNNQKFIVKAETVHTYLLFYKPEGIVCSKKSQGGDKTIFNILPENYFNIKDKLIIGGRLDKESRGLMLLSTDGNFINEMTHPSFNHKKKYLVKTINDIDFDKLKELATGFNYEDEKYMPFEYEIIENKKIVITLKEGKKHEVRNIIKATNNMVKDLLRIQIGDYLLDGMKKGEYKEISP